MEKFDDKVLEVARRNVNRPYDHKLERAVFEYCGIQRTGKTTLMVADDMNKLLNPYFGYDYVPDELHCNFWLDIDGVHCWDNEQMKQVLLIAKREKWQHKIFAVDECSQPPLFYARNTADKLQTELVTSIWQMPKQGHTFQYTSNVGNSVDVQQRDATWYTIMPVKYHHFPENREREYIVFRVIAGYDIWTADYVYKYPALTQRYFDSFRPVN